MPERIADRIRAFSPGEIALLMRAFRSVTGPGSLDHLESTSREAKAAWLAAVWLYLLEV